MADRDLAREVTPSREPIVLDPEAPGPRVVAIDTGIKDSIVRNWRERGVRLELHPCTRHAPPSCGPASPTRSSWPTAPATRPRSATSSTPCASSWAASRCTGSASATSSCAAPSAWTPTSCPSATAAPTTRSRTSPPGGIDITSQNHGFAVVGPDGEGTHRRRRARPLGDRLRRRRAHPAQPLRPHGRGPGAARRARRGGAVPPRGGARAPTTPTTCSTTSWGDRTRMTWPGLQQRMEGERVILEPLRPSTPTGCARRRPSRVWRWLVLGDFDRWLARPRGARGEEAPSRPRRTHGGRSARRAIRLRPSTAGSRSGGRGSSPPPGAPERTSRPSSDARPRLRGPGLPAGRVQDPCRQRAVARAMEALPAPSRASTASTWCPGLGSATRPTTRSSTTNGPRCGQPAAGLEAVRAA